MFLSNLSAIPGHSPLQAGGVQWPSADLTPQLDLTAPVVVEVLAGHGEDRPEEVQPGPDQAGWVCGQLTVVVASVLVLHSRHPQTVVVRVLEVQGEPEEQFRSKNYITLPYSTVEYVTLCYSTLHYIIITVQCSMAQYNTLYYIT